MPYKINVSLKKDADAAQLDQAKKQVSDQGGKVVNEYKLVKGFTYAYAPFVLKQILTLYSAEFPDDKVHSLQSNDHVNVEADSKVTTQ
ncbi:hypothetical protein M409DRAFT_21566 [Zasmidium cellare ATCC 36951]|uniref:Inhibitor I9 domain-containing protein n=1 Tax=Zasmidium cellare ATCC 36951 TaxID=1080233 RepID=A0A6A6CQR5_ZASCE|nr:uncharacterized protein M409DRAFT_21566 [Zasmidium cellare ATCC 36951]KAF2168119.1 hypothetical protein M409DRAFT_21566 [Zasmidium cellare ATCC 36951]